MTHLLNDRLPPDDEDLARERRVLRELRRTEPRYYLELWKRFYEGELHNDPMEAALCQVMRSQLLLGDAPSVRETGAQPKLHVLWHVLGDPRQQGQKLALLAHFKDAFGQQLAA